MTLPRSSGLLLAAILLATFACTQPPSPTPLPGDAAAGIERVGVGGSPTGLALGDGYLWVAVRSGQNEHQLWRIDRATGKSTEVPAGQGAIDLAVGEGAVWVVCSDGDNPCHGPALLKIDPETGALLQTIPTGGGGKLAVGLGYVWDGTSDGLLKIDPASGKVLSKVAASWPVIAGDTLWVKGGQPETADGSVRLFRLDPQTVEILRTVVVEHPCQSAGSTKAVLVATCGGAMKGGDVLQAFSPATGQVFYQLPIPMWGSMAVDNGTLWLSGHLPGFPDQPINLAEIDITTGQVLRPPRVIDRGTGKEFGFDITCGMCGVPVSDVVADESGGLWLTDPAAGQVIHVKDPSVLPAAPFAPPPASSPSVSAPTPDAFPLVGEWHATRIDGKPTGKPKPTLVMGTHAVHASDGCNRFGFAYQTQGDRFLTWGRMVSTLVGCGPPGQQAAFRNTVGADSITFQLEGDTLTLSTSSGGDGSPGEVVLQRRH
jgi:heat shock protein HslJ